MAGALIKSNVNLHIRLYRHSRCICAYVHCELCTMLILHTEHCHVRYNSGGSADELRVRRASAGPRAGFGGLWS